MLTETSSKPIEEFRSYEEYGDECDWILTRDENEPLGPLVRKRVLQKFVRVGPILNLHVPGRIIETAEKGTRLFFEMPICCKVYGRFL